MPTIPDGFKSFTANRIQNASGGALAAGTLGVVTTDANDIPIPVVAGGAGGLITENEDQTPIVAGTIGASFVVADTQAGFPNFFYRVIVREPDGTPIARLKKVQTLDDIFNLDSYNPSTGHSSAGSGGSSSAPDLIFASPDSSLWRLARIDGALSAVAYTGSLFAQTLYLTDTNGSGHVYQILIDNGGQIDWQLVTGQTGLASVTIVDDDTEVSATLTITDGVETWT